MEATREPKRRNLARTKAKILAAAAEVFQESGYAGAGLREIAWRADVAPSLVSKHFGNKAALFEQALLQVIQDNTVFTWDKAVYGETMAQLVQGVGNTNITAMLVLAMADPEAKEIASRIQRREMIEPLAEFLGPPNGQARAMNMFAVLTGFLIQMRGLNVGPIPESSLAWLSRTLQAIIDGHDEMPAVEGVERVKPKRFLRAK